MHTLKIQLVDTDCGNFIDGNTFMNVAVHDGIRKPVLVKFTYNDDGTESVTVGNASMLSGISCGMHLIQLVSEAILNAFTEDHEFFVDVFYDEGEKVPLTIEVPTRA